MRTKPQTSTWSLWVDCNPGSSSKLELSSCSKRLGNIRDGSLLGVGDCDSGKAEARLILRIWVIQPQPLLQLLHDRRLPGAIKDTFLRPVGPNI